MYQMKWEPLFCSQNKLSFDANFSSFSLAESPPRDLKITASLKLLPSNGLLLMRNVVQLCLATNNILQRFSPSCDRSCVEMVELLASRRYSLKNKLDDRMIKQLWNSVIAKYRDLSVSRRSICSSNNCELFSWRSHCRRCRGCPFSREGGGGGTQQSFIWGGYALRSKPLPFYIPLSTEKVSLLYTFYWQIV